MEKHTHADMKHFCGNMGAVRGEVMRFNQDGMLVWDFEPFGSSI